MHVDFKQAEVLRETPVVFRPCFQHHPRLVFGLELGDDLAVPLVDEEKHYLGPVTRRVDVLRNGRSSCGRAA
jgi:hypothetical protein